MNPMKEIKLEKLTLNIGAGEAGSKLEKAQKLIEKLSNKKVVITKTHSRTTFGVAKHKPIGVKVTLRGSDAKELLKTLLQALENKLKKSSFDDNGNFSFGIHEYINIPGIKYDPDIGILGLDVCVTLYRAGYRVRKKALKPGKVGRKHLITKTESMEWAKKELNIEIVD